MHFSHGLLSVCLQKPVCVVYRCFISSRAIVFILCFSIHFVASSRSLCFEQHTLFSSNVCSCAEQDSFDTDFGSVSTICSVSWSVGRYLHALRSGWFSIGRSAHYQVYGFLCLDLNNCRIIIVKMNIIKRGRQEARDSHNSQIRTKTRAQQPKSENEVNSVPNKLLRSTQMVRQVGTVVLERQFQALMIAVDRSDSHFLPHFCFTNTNRFYRRRETETASSTYNVLNK